MKTFTYSYFICPTQHACDNYELAVRVTPNPADAQATVSLMERDDDGVLLPQTIEKIEVIDLFGKTVHRSEPQLTEVHLETAGYKPGTYLIRIPINGQVVTEQLVIKPRD
jgi:Secretion system C-terminal sorting domain